MAQVLAGSVCGSSTSGGPIRFVRVTDVLSTEEQERLWQTVIAPEARYRPSNVGSGDKARLDPKVRHSLLMEDTDSLRPWFLPRIAELVAREHVLERLGLSPFPVGVRELQVTRHIDGGFYHNHRDAGEGESALRTLTYVYYFHRLPRSFAGGDILLFDHGPDDARSKGLEFTRIEPTHDSLVFFASDRLHAVTKVICPGADPSDGRWTINGWYHRDSKRQT